ncbi:MAG: pilus assembly protein TadG-related protein [Pseudomonadota bacterium]
MALRPFFQSQSLINASKSFRANQDGGLTYFSLVIFFVTILMAGMAVDFMHLETQRYKIQSVADAAALAAADVQNEQGPNEVITAYFEAAGIEHIDRQVRITQTDSLREVRVLTEIETPTFFMSLGQKPITKLESPVVAAAMEYTGNVEISLVVDVSASMTTRKMRALRRASSEFVDIVLDGNSDDSKTTLNFVAYNRTVVAGDKLLSRLNANGSQVWPGLDSRTSFLPGAKRSYSTEQNDATCIRWYDQDMTTTTLTPSQPLERVAHFGWRPSGNLPPIPERRWCIFDRNEIQLMQTDAGSLKRYINDESAFNATGGTAIDVGVKWGASLLDPSFRPVVTNMIATGDLSADATSRPAPFKADQPQGEETVKALVLMTDGQNNRGRDLKDQYKRGLSNIWYSHRAGGTSGAARNASGYYVFLPHHGGRPWYRPASGSYHTFEELPGYVAPPPPPVPDADGNMPPPLPPHNPWYHVDVAQMDWQEVWRYWTTIDAARFFYQGSSPSEYQQMRDAWYFPEDNIKQDIRTRMICDAAKAKDIVIFTVAFEAPENGERLMRYCATSSSHYFEASGEGLEDVFARIAAYTRVLRLTL